MKTALHEVATALDHASAEMELVREELAKEKKARKLTTRIGVGLVVLFFAASSFFAVTLLKIQDNAEADCDRTNDARSNLREGFTFLADKLVGEDPTTEVQAARDDYVAELQIMFPDIDC